MGVGLQCLLNLSEQIILLFHLSVFGVFELCGSRNFVNLSKLWGNLRLSPTEENFVLQFNQVNGDRVL